MKAPLLLYPRAAIALCMFIASSSLSQAWGEEICECTHSDVAADDVAGNPKSFTRQALSLPQDFPESFSASVQLEGRTHILKLSRNSVFGKNTRILICGEGGVITEVDPGPVRTYLGQIDGMEDSSVSALLTETGLVATISRLGMEDVTVEPQGGDHRVFSENQEAKVPMRSGAAKAFTTKAAKSGGSSGATLPPSRVMDVLEYEIGVEIGSRAFNSDTYNSNMSTAMASAQSTANNLDRRYLSGAGIKHTVGTVIIRTDNATDPLRNRVTATGGANNAGSSLAAFRDYWNSNPDEVGDTHDLAVYHVRSNPSGLAYVNSVGSGNRYATSGGNAATSWADGTLVHEFGHSWNLRHNNVGPISEYDYESGNEPPSQFYEAKPRKGSGSLLETHTYISVMNGRGARNIGRLSTDEANTVYNIRNGKRRFGTLVADPGQQKPFGHRDVVSSIGDPITIDVIANDYDVNNDVLELQLRDTTSEKGGIITLSEGTGPGGRNEIIYTPPASNGTDFFHYTVCDSSGLTDWGAVYVINRGPVVVDIDTALEEYNYDFGPQGAPIKNGWVGIPPNVEGDIFWSGGGIDGINRGSQASVNEINQDFVSSNGSRTLSHKIANGIWRVTLTLGDFNNPIDQVRVSAEDEKVVEAGINRAAAEFKNVVFNVAVADGQLDLHFSDEGGSSANWALNRMSIRLSESTIDSDDDGLEDRWEFLFFESLTATDGLPSQDSDGDKLSDREEFNAETNPTNSDTDSDNLSDFSEINEFGTEPTMSDTDGDGINDGIEIAYRSDPRNTSRRPNFEGLVAHYTFDEGSGTIAMNSAAVGDGSDAAQNQGTINWSTTGQRIGGASLDLDGGSSLLAPSPMPDGATGMTISVWVNPDASGQFEGIYVGRENPGNWGVNIQGTQADVRFAKLDGGSEGVDTDADSVTPDGGWYHIVLTWASTGDASFGAVYLNGVQVKTTTAARSDFTQPTQGFFIGDDPCCPGREFDGQIDDLAVFSRALSSEEIANVYAGGQRGDSILETLSPPAFFAPELAGVTIDSESGNVSFQFETLSDVGYRIYSSPDLINWNLIQTIYGDGNVFDFSHMIDSEAQFYRIE